MNDTELAQRVVALGVGSKDGFPTFCFENDSLTAEQFVRDWRVAGALMEKFESLGVVAMTIGSVELYHKAVDPRAIILACLEALE